MPDLRVRNSDEQIEEHNGSTTEDTPLLANEITADVLQLNTDPIHAKIALDEQLGSNNDDDDDDTPLPKFQIFILCCARIVEPIAFFSIFPFIGKMIYDTGTVPESDVGFYSGLIESLFSIAQMCTMLVWGRIADRYGRRPVLIISLLGLAFGMGGFGFATNVQQMIMFRCFAGLFSGSQVTIRAMITENATNKTKARAFSLFTIAGTLGLFTGPFLGGALSDPVEQYPGVFGGNHLFMRYPYALATMVTGGFGIAAAVLCIFCLKETLETKTKGAAAVPLTPREVLQVPGVPVVLFILCWAMIGALGFTAVIPVFWFTSPSLGGFGLTPIQISGFLALSGMSQTLWTLLAFPPLQKRYGAGGVLRICYTYYPITMIIAPIASILARNNLRVGFWIVALYNGIVGSGVSMGGTAMQLVLNDISPSNQSLGTLNAIAMTMISAISAVAPAAYASLFAFGVHNRILGGYLVWAVFFSQAIVLAVIIHWIPEKAYGRPVKTSPERRSTADETQ